MHITLLFQWPAFFVPASTPHALLNPIPYTLHNLPIPPSSTSPLLRVPLLHLGARYASPPALDGPRDVFSPPANVDTQGVLEQIGRILPFVTLELPSLTCREDGNHTVPVIRFELLGSVDEDEAEGALIVN